MWTKPLRLTKCPAALNHILPRYHFLIPQSSFYLSGKAVSGPISAPIIEIFSATQRGKICLVSTPEEEIIPRGKIMPGSFHMILVPQGNTREHKILKVGNIVHRNSVQSI